MAGIKDAVNNLKTVEGTLANNKVANFCYTDTAYTNNQANGVSDYDYEREQNIPVASTEVLKTNETVFLKGFRSQASSITRMLLNHFFGRVSYNLNKTADVLNGLLTNLYSYLGTANGIATLDANGRVPASQLPETAMEFKGTWNCATNTTSTSINLINGQGTKGDLYLCSVEGWFNASTGTGSATKPSPDTGYVQYFVNDRIVYDGSTWNRLSSGDIQRVNGLSPTDGNVQITRRVTQAQYNALTSAEKEGHIFIITDVNMNDLYVINDAVTASDSVWSSQKTFASISVVSATSKTITGTAIANGSVIRVFFKADITASDTSTALQLTYNGTAYTVKVPKDGALQNYVAFEVSSGVYKYLQAYTTLELLFDGTQFVVIGNPVILSGSNYLYYADGSHNVNEVTVNNMHPVTSNAVYKASVAKNPYIELHGTGTVYDFINLLITKGLYTLGETKEISQVTLFDNTFSFVFTDYTESISTINSTWIFRGVCSILDANNSSNTFSIEVISREGNVYYYSEDRPVYGGLHKWTKLI